jgi:hypothetical protein
VAITEDDRLRGMRSIASRGKHHPRQQHAPPSAPFRRKV